MAAEKFTVDLSKPLVFQVGHLGEAYDEWVHRPIVSKETPRFFANGIMEFFTRTAWWVIPAVWLPVVVYSTNISVNMGLSPQMAAASLVAGVLIWSLMEYTLHRFLFHVKTTSYWANTLHFLLHGCHHKHPMDGLRLVFPPAATAIFLPPVYAFMRLISSEQVSYALFAGGLLGYVIYDLTHYFIHFGKPSNGNFHNLKRYHMNHHFRIQDKGFGITSTFWDKIFGTLPPQPEFNKKSS